MTFHLQIQLRFLQAVRFTRNPFYAVAIDRLFKITGGYTHPALQFVFWILVFIFFKQVKYAVWKQGHALPLTEKLFYQFAAFQPFVFSKCKLLWQILFFSCMNAFYSAVVDYSKTKIAPKMLRGYNLFADTCSYQDGCKVVLF